MNPQGVFEKWFRSLNAQQRASAVTTVGAVPEWMIESLRHAGIVTVEADVGSLSVVLMPVHLREFLERKRLDQPDTATVDANGLLHSSTAVVDAALELVVALATATIADADGVSVTLERHGRMMTVAASNADVRVIDQHQYDTGEGPCLDAAAKGAWFYVEALTEERRWPDFVARALDHEVRTILSSPLRTNGAPQGSLNVYSSTEHAFAEGHRDRVAVLADQASKILTIAAPDRSSEQTSHMFGLAVRARQTIHRAEGIIMHRLELTADAASAILHNAARVEGVTVLEYASLVVDQPGHHNGSM